MDSVLSADPEAPSNARANSTGRAHWARGDRRLWAWNCCRPVYASRPHRLALRASRSSYGESELIGILALA